MKIGLQEIILGIAIFDSIFFAVFCAILDWGNIFLFAIADFSLLLGYFFSAFVTKHIEDKL